MLYIRLLNECSRLALLISSRYNSIEVVVVHILVNIKFLNLHLLKTD